MAEAAARSTRAPERISLLEIAGDGAMAGLYGASAVAIWFLIVDALTREPLFTPALVGNAVLNGTVSPAARIDLFAVAAYTVIHCTAFTTFGILYAWALARMRRTPDYALIAISVFVPLQVCFILATRMLVPGVAEVIGHTYIVVGNVGAALLMAFYLRVGQRHLDDPVEDDAPA